MKLLAARTHQLLDQYYQSFSFVGLVFATLFFAGSVTPSLLPRIWIVQGFLSGFSLAAGYVIGVLLVWLWQWLELPQPNQRWKVGLKRCSVALVSVVAFFFVWQSTAWQNSLRRLMEMPELETTAPFYFLLVAIAVAITLVTLARAFIASVQRLSRRLQRYVPRRLSLAISSLVVAAIVFTITNGVIVRGLLRSADRVFRQADELIDDGAEPPMDELMCGGPDSLVPWKTIGRRGKNFLMTGPTAAEISDFTRRDARQPIRVSVGMSEDDNVQAQASLALAELIRVGGFNRKVLVVATPTGTGWLDEGAVDTIEYLHNGDTAIVSTQYSYLPSWITILVDPNRSRRSAKALFDAVYGHWTILAKEERPNLYLFGLSLGALGCEEAADLLDTFEDPIQGAVWSGPPFPSPQWNRIVHSRQPQSPIWMPRYRDESMVQFTGQKNHLLSGDSWGPIRNVYIQHASDPMVWFSPDLAWQRPEWLNTPRGPDVSPVLRWFPVLTFLQVAFDIPLATSVPIGYGHNYSASSYIDAWAEVTRPTNWTAEELARLKKNFRQRETTMTQ